jgi:hypothetical protein
MATLSPRFSFTLPDPADTVDITKLNADFVTIDNTLGLTPCTLGTRPSSPIDGQAIYERDTHDVLVWDASVGAGTWHYIVPVTKSVASDVSVISDIVGVSATDLTITMAAQTTYALDAFIAFNSPTAADAVLSFFLPSGASCLLTSGAQPVAATTTAGSIETAVTTVASLTLGGTGALSSAVLNGTVTTGLAGGNIVANWAQAVATASNTTLKAGSWLRLQRI